MAENQKNKIKNTESDKKKLDTIADLLAELFKKEDDFFLKYKKPDDKRP